jgi:hypothetical protein
MTFDWRSCCGTVVQTIASPLEAAEACWEEFDKASAVCTASNGRGICMLVAMATRFLDVGQTPVDTVCSEVLGGEDHALLG